MKTRDLRWSQAKNFLLTGMVPFVQYQIDMRNYFWAVDTRIWANYPSRDYKSRQREPYQTSELFKVLWEEPKNED